MKTKMKIYYLALILILTGSAGAKAQVTIGTPSNPHGGALLDLQQPDASKKMGLKLPVVSLSDANQYGLSSGESSTAAGMMVYNNNPDIANGYGVGVYVWDGSKWSSVLGGSGSTGGGVTSCGNKRFTIQLTGAPAAMCTGNTLEGISLQTMGGTAPYTYTSTDFNTDGTIKTGITMPSQDKVFGFRVTDAGGCFLDYAITLPMQTAGCGTPVIPVTVGSLTFMDRNLGADAGANANPGTYSAGNNTSPTGLLNGDYYQWGRQADGHQKWNSAIVAGPTNANDGNDQVPQSNPDYYGKFVKASGNWRNSDGSGSWTGAGGTANPCPTGYHVPTSAEWTTVNNAVTAANRNALTASRQGIAIGSSNLFLPAAGCREGSSGSFNYVGTSGYYWSSTGNGTTYANYLLFSSGGSTVFSNYIYYRSYGFSVRCVKN